MGRRIYITRVASDARLGFPAFALGTDRTDQDARMAAHSIASANGLRVVDVAWLGHRGGWRATLGRCGGKWYRTLPPYTSVRYRIARRPRRSTRSADV
jgi:hypothetical protein